MSMTWGLWVSSDSWPSSSLTWYMLAPPRSNSVAHERRNVWGVTLAGSRARRAVAWSRRGINLVASASIRYDGNGKNRENVRREWACRVAVYDVAGDFLRAQRGNRGRFNQV